MTPQGLREKANFSSQFNKSACRANHLKVCPAPPAKIFRLTRRANHLYSSARLTRERGGSRVVTNARWDAVDAKVATDERDSSGRRSRVVLAPDAGAKLCGDDPRSDGGKRARLTGEIAK